ncbi:MAG: M67 family metallopeptidase, partial [Chloroflexota bacterium]
ARLLKPREPTLREECCGLLYGKGSRVEQVVWMENIEHSPLNYRVSPRAYIAMEDAMAERGLSHIGFYHSHTDSPATPSRTDIRYASHGYPDMFQVIVSLADPDSPVLRAFTIASDETVREVVVR